ncbi:anti-sigma factor antagonist [Anaerobacillus alkaliphilus]|uniref:Anti-sigma factor antagonist n=1 Tax=Anaerobacillus alkaliphilus TaxID=1548597 RepID=A0A4Q0VS10_9BACI|nr:STAS domain-containing protein [Anaerobacillus alkaliphilus]RXI98200.1 anti-sigma factor antagonist [Anaerobacillus alkaliphilus]
MGEFSQRNIDNRIEVLLTSIEITVKNVNEFKGGLEKLLNSNSNYLLLDLSKTIYMNSAALGCIADTVMKAKKLEKEIVIGGIQSTILEVFKIIKFESFVTLFTDLDEAINYLQEK